MDAPDEKTLHYYNHNAELLYDYYASVAEDTGVSRYFESAFPKGRVLDIGSGSGRDTLTLLRHGYEVYGVDASPAMVEVARRHHPELSDRLSVSALPALPEIREKYDSILCSAVLMHIPKEYLFDSVYRIRELLNESGRVLVSLPIGREIDQDSHRDENGRLFYPYQPEYIKLLFERIGFACIGHWTDKDSRDRNFSWSTMLFQLNLGGELRPLDEIEGILNRDRKTATYKLALFRALCDISREAANSVLWSLDGKVGVPLPLIANRWLIYYWRLFEDSIFFPQHRGETEENRKIAFRREVAPLIAAFQNQGGLDAFLLAWKNAQLSDALSRALNKALKKISEVIIRGPVTYAGGSLESGRVFEYDRQTNMVFLQSGLWREISLMNHWISDALILRWAELTHLMSQKQIPISQVVDVLLDAPTADRYVLPARNAYEELPEKYCIWSGKSLGKKFAVDHVIPFALWHNNDLWNLLPADEKLNSKKSDKLPTNELLHRQKDCFVYHWEFLQNKYPARFAKEYQQFTGDSQPNSNWQNQLFASLVEAVNITAQQRGIERWAPVAL